MSDTQKRFHDYYAVASTENINEKMDRLLQKCVAEGMQVTKSGNWTVQIGPGSWLCDGVVIQETTAVSQQLQISPPSDQDRIDVVYGTYTYDKTSPPPEASYGVLQGTASASPQPPDLPAQSVKLAEIYVPANATSLDDCTIRNVYNLKDQLSMLLGIKVEGNLFIRSDDPWNSEKWIKDGDLWLDTDTKTLYVWDEPSGQWVPPTIPPHAPTHQEGGVDELDVSTLADVNGYLHLGNKETHDAMHLDHAQLSNVQPDQHHARDHAARHMPGGGDELPWGHEGGTNADMVDGQHASAFAPVNHTHAGYASDPHGNEAHMPAFAEEGHQHPLSDITGTQAIGFMGPVQLATEAVPATGGVIWEIKVPNLSIPGTEVVITELRCHVATAPDDNITYTFKRGTDAIGQVTIPSGGSDGNLSLNPPVVLAAGDILRVVAPANGHGAKGLSAFFVIQRRQVS